MTWHDLTHLITSAMPVYPGTEPPELLEATTLEKEGFRETQLRLFSHTGTHMDAPSHMIAGAPSLDSMAIGAFAGAAVKVDLSSFPPGRAVPRSFLEEALEGAFTPDFVLLHTGWDRFWGTEEYFSPFPTLTPDGAAYLATRALKGVGVDAISVDPMESVAFPVHRALLSRGLVIVENLRGLGELPLRGFTFLALPLHYADADGAPVRAAALLSA